MDQPRELRWPYGSPRKRRWRSSAPRRQRHDQVRATMRNNAKSLSVLLALFLGSAAYAQAPNPGFREQPDETLPAFESGAALSGAAPDNVNLFTGDPSIAIPLGSGYPLSPAFRWQPALHYSVKSWRLEPKGCSYPHPTEPNQFVDNQYARVRGFPGVGYGWTFHMGMVATNMPLRGYVYYSPDGGEHDFMGDSPYFPGPPSLNPGAGSFRTVSSSKYRLTVLPGEYVITAPDGTTYHHMQAFTFPGPAGPAQQARDYTDFTTSGVDQHAQMMGLSHINDRFGNRVLTVNYGSAPKHWRIESITIEGGGLAASTIALTWSPLSIATPNGPLTWDVITNISLPAFEGRTLNATLTYNMTGGEGSGTDRSIRRNGYDTANGAHPSCPASPTHVFVPFLDEVSFSEGSTPAPLDPKTPIRTYRFAYKFASESNGYDTTHEGVLRKMTIPTGGVVEYTYGFTTPGPHYFNYDLQRDETDLPSPTGPAAPPPPPDYPEIQAPTDDSPAVISRTESFVSASGLANYSSTTTFSRVQSAQLTPFNLAVSSVARRVVVKRPSGNGSDVLATMHIFAVPQEKGAQAGGLELERRVYEGPTAAGPPIRTTIFGYEGAEMLLCVSPCTPGWSGRSTVAGYKNPDGFSRYKWVADVLPVSEATWYGAAPASQTVCDANNATPIACTTTLSTLYNSEALAHTTSTSYAFPAGSNGLWTPGHLSRASTTAWTNVGPKWIFGLYGSKAQSDSWTALSGGCSAERSPCSTSTSSTFDEFGRLTYRSVSAGSRSLAVEYSVPDGQGAFKEERLFAPSSDGTLTTDEIKTVRTFQRGLVTSRVVSSPTLASPDFASVFLDRDPTTGLVKSAYESYKANDTNRRTDFRFDALGKLGKILPPGSGATSDPDRKAKFSKPTWICYDMGQSYTTKDAITIFREWDRPCLSFQDAPLLPTPADQSDMPTLRYHYDGFGRMVMEEKYVPSSKADLRIGRRLTKYLPNGAVGSQSTWADVACNLPPGSPVGCTPDLPLAGQFTTYSTSSNFDPFGRARLMTQPDGSVTNLSFADGLITHSDTKTTETLSGISGPSGASVTRVETTQRDLLGHVLSVTQAASGAVTQPAFTTTYAYNGLDKLTRVVQPGLSNREF
ncbi:MAG: hypothetical protein JNK60_12790, partial [Acidobacteria bacterium]|nr:hypothetical protein [Acidobacteriota bacterium]